MLHGTNVEALPQHEHRVRRPKRLEIELRRIEASALRNRFCS
jgi:hypothetical protein